MTTGHFIDKFNRDDGTLGEQYEVACGVAQIADEAVMPVDFSAAVGGSIEAATMTTDQKTQVLYIAEDLDRADVAVRAAVAHLIAPVGVDLVAETSNDPAFTLLARMSKDPNLVDYGVQEDPNCYDQGYGLRLTCPRSGAAPILKLVKYVPKVVAPGNQLSVTAGEVDNVQVLMQVTLTSHNLHTEQGWDGEGLIPYQGETQFMRLRVRRADDQVILEGYFNDRTNTPILSYTDYSHPLWGVVGKPGFEFISAALNNQPQTSPYQLAAAPLMICLLFEAETIKDNAPARSSSPKNRWTYDRCAERVILLVEKAGDSKYAASSRGQAKKLAYLDFLYEAERYIIAREGYHPFLLRNGRVHLKADTDTYELPENCGEVLAIYPGNFSGQPFREMLPNDFAQLLASRGGSAGDPAVFRYVESPANDRLAIKFYPVPKRDALTDGTPLYFTLDYYARFVEPEDPAQQVPLIPQEHIEVLTYFAAARAFLNDQDQNTAMTMRQAAEEHYQVMVRSGNRRYASRQARIVPASQLSQGRLGPLTRVDSLRGGPRF